MLAMAVLCGQANLCVIVKTAVWFSDYYRNHKSLDYLPYSFFLTGIQIAGDILL